MKSLRLSFPPAFDRLSRSPGTALLGLVLDGHRLEGVAIRRNNGSATILKSFECTLSLDPLKDEPTLVGREIRKQLDAAGIRERRCVVGLPLSWTLSLTTALPNLPEADLDSFLDLAAERGLPYHPDTLLVARSRFHAPPDTPFATLVAVPRERLAQLEASLRAAQLRPLSFSLGITALQPAEAHPTEPLLTMAIGESNVALQVSAGGGVAALRVFEDAFERSGPDRIPQVDHLVRELRITLGQLSPSLRNALRRLLLFGSPQATRQLLDHLRPRLRELGLIPEAISRFPPDAFRLQLPADHLVSPALALGLRRLGGARSTLEFLPPKSSAWHRFQARYPAGNLAYTGAALGCLLAVTLGAFLFQHAQLRHWQSQWKTMEPTVAQLENLQRQTQTYRPWFDDSFRCLTILQRLTESFPENGSVTARSVEIQSQTVLCTGTATDHQALLQTLDRLRHAHSVASPQVEQIRGSAPLQFVFKFQWADEGLP